jgi:putative peptide zinc metalloprotease protein
MTLMLRPDVVFTPRSMGGEGCYIVEDAVNSKYYSIGIPEYTFISCLDGKTSVAKALSLTARALPQDALTEEDAAAICRWLVESELAFTAESGDAHRLAQAAQDKSRPKWAQWNPLFMKIPLWFPDRFFSRCSPPANWLFSKPMAVLTLFGVLLATYQVLAHWNQFLIASQGIFSPSRWIWLGLCWLFLKIVHEFSHGAVCKRYGGNVHEAGVILILFAPLAYVDVTSSWRFKSKWQRIYTAAAGMYIELMIASIATLMWVRTEPGFINDICFNVVIMASVTTLAFNANPLMRFDAYYILSDLVDIPNLYTDGQTFLRYLGRRYLLGIPTELSTGSWSRDAFIRLYGVAAFLWRMSITFFLIVAAATMFEGAGIILALLATVCWLAVPAVKFATYMIRGDAWEKPSRVRFTCLVLPAVLGAMYLANRVPWPGVTRAAAIVEYSPLAVVRAGSPGFIREIHVQSGQFVEQSQIIASLENHDLWLELHDLELAIEQSVLESRALKQKEEMAAYQAEQKTLLSLRKKLAEKRTEAEQLTVRAPISGRVVLRNPAFLLGTYASLGTEIVSIGDEARKELRVAIDQQDVDAFLNYVGKSISIRLPGGVRLACPLTRVPPRASVDPPHVSLCAPYGGRLEVRAREAGQSDDPTDQFELTSPGFTGIVRLPPTDSARLRVGQRGVVWLARGQETMGGYLLGFLRDQIPESFAHKFNLQP